jgi:hypothetical protein
LSFREAVEHSISRLLLMERAARRRQAEEQLLAHRSRVAAAALSMCGEKTMNEAVEEYWSGELRVENLRL